MGSLSKCFQIVNDVEAELRLMRLEKLYRGGSMVEIGGHPYYFAMCLQRWGADLTTIDLAPQRMQKLIKEQSLRVVGCDIERENLPFDDNSVATITLCDTFEHLRVDPIFAL